jgi:hypothetical protein
VLVPYLPVGGGLSKSDERSVVWIERWNLENEYLVPMGLPGIKESFARSEN